MTLTRETLQAKLKEITELAHRIEYGSPRAPQHARKIRELTEEITPK